MKTEKITLGGRDFDVPELTIEQLEDLADSIDALSTSGGGRAVAVASRDIVRVALSDAYPEMTADKLRKLRTTYAELNAAVTVVLRISGLRQDAPGEPLPVVSALSLSASELSNEGSLPASDGTIEPLAA